MSLEKALADNTAAIEANTAALEKLAANQTKALAKIGAKEEPAEGTTETRSTRRSRADKDEPAETTTRTRRDRSAPAEEAEEPRSSRRSRDAEEEEPRSARRSREEKPKKVTTADVRAAFADFMDTDDADEEASRRKFLDSVLDEVDADKTSDIKEADFERVLEWVATKKAGKKVNFDR